MNKARFENNQENFDLFLKDCKPEETKIVMESTGVWEFIYDMLESKNYRIKLANPIKTKAIACAKIKTDSVDAGTLADLLRANLIAESYIPDRETRKIRDVVRQRKSIVKGKTQIKNRIHAILTRHGIKLPYASLCNKAIIWMLEEGMNNLPSAKTILVSYVNILKKYDEELEAVDEKIREIAYSSSKTNLLMTIPGVAEIRAVEIMAEIADISRFESSEKLCSYAGLVPSIRQSGDSLRFGCLIREASRTLKHALIESSWALLRSKQENSLKIFYQNLLYKKSKQKAICALARKLCCVIHSMLRKNQEFHYS
jgi:transposase